ncbi:hypothetical protein T459_05462 [Capsicum annuum]|uniref:Retrotransposon gag domain-containing protein n=1 Tax=Capsicum annuum TaxID=4072 RepID=A0A2G3A7W2_CAPAN|nr:hypothetical protein T459_05462 [Capsicum annuum]
MVKCVRITGDSITESAAAEMEDLREMMQNLVTEVGNLAGKVSSLERLDSVVMELRQQLVGEGRRNNVPLGHEENHDQEWGIGNKERSPNYGTISQFSNSFNFQHSHFNRWSRMKFLKFSRDDLRSWLFKIEKFFSMENIAPEDKVTIASMQLEGEAIQWHVSFMRYRQYVQATSWKEYVGALVERFKIDFNDPKEEIKKIKQTGSVREYQAAFERILTRVNLSEENAISCYIGGLKTELNIAIKITKPFFLSQAYKSAKMQEAYLFAIRQHSSNSFQVNARKFVDQKYSNSKGILPTPNSITSGFSKRLYLLGVDESEDLNESQIEQDGEVQEEQGDQLELGQLVEHMEISMHALNGSLGFRTLKVTGYHSKMKLHILIDTGSSHNFIDPDLVSKLGCEVKPIKPEVVAAANGSMQVDKMTTITWLLQGAEFCADFLLLPLGSCGVVLGVQWLLTLGGIKLNFRKLPWNYGIKERNIYSEVSAIKY